MVYIDMKRSRQDQDHDHNITTMANYLILLSRGSQQPDTNESSPSRVFECKTCNRQFASFQALGGHRASHKKPRLGGGDSNLSQSSEPTKPKTHECSICGLEFAIGQALGGHMRRHRSGLNERQSSPASPSGYKPVVKKVNSRRILCLDLNLTPYENDLEFRLGKRATPLVDFCL